MFDKVEPLAVGEGYLTDYLFALLSIDLHFARLLVEQAVEDQLEAEEDGSSSEDRGSVVQNTSVDHE